MDFTTMRRRLGEGAYGSWDALQADLRLMFRNCMTYNPAGTVYHKQACLSPAVLKDALRVLHPPVDLPSASEPPTLAFEMQPATPDQS